MAHFISMTEQSKLASLTSDEKSLHIHVHKVKKCSEYTIKYTCTNCHNYYAHV